MLNCLSSHWWEWRPWINAHQQHSWAPLCRLTCGWRFPGYFCTALWAGMKPVLSTCSSHVLFRLQAVHFLWVSYVQLAVMKFMLLCWSTQVWRHFAFVCTEEICASPRKPEIISSNQTRHLVAKHKQICAEIILCALPLTLIWSELQTSG